MKLKKGMAKGRQLMEHHPFITIEYDGKHFLYIDWKGYVSVDQVKSGCEMILHAALKKNCFDWLNDNRQVLGTWTQAVRWISQDFLPRIVQRAPLKIAFIYSKKASARYSVDKLLEENDEYNAQTFEEYEPAEQWLLNQIDTGMPDVGASENLLRFRGQSRHYILAPDEINYIVANGKSLLVNTESGSLSVKGTLEEICQRLRNSPLMRVHRSYILNVDKISHIAYHAGGSYVAYLKKVEKLAIPISRTYAASLRKRLGLGQFPD